MPDGVKIALDALLPPLASSHRNAGYDCVLIQCRYMRGICSRWPFSLLTGRRPIDLINQDLKLALLKANFAVVSIDVRGTGWLVELLECHETRLASPSILCCHPLRTSLILHEKPQINLLDLGRLKIFKASATTVPSITAGNYYQGRGTEYNEPLQSVRQFWPITSRL